MSKHLAAFNGLYIYDALLKQGNYFIPARCELPELSLHSLSAQPV